MDETLGSTGNAGLESSETVATPSTESTSESKEVSWKWAENLPGEGKMPEWYDQSKYATVEEHAQANAKEAEESNKRALGLRKVLSQKGDQTPDVQTAPEDYKLNIEQNLANEIGLTNDDPMLNKFRTICKENNIPQSFFDKTLEGISQFAQTQLKENQQEQDTLRQSTIEAQDVYYQEEMAKLGDNAKERLSALITWGEKNFEGEMLESFKDNMISADRVIAWESLRNKIIDGANIPGTLPASKGTDALEMARDFLKDGKWADSAQGANKLVEMYQKSNG